MNIPDPLKNALAGLPLAEVRFFESIDSTNTHCLNWAGEGAGDLALAIADHQSAGRGRADRRWMTNPGSALAFSLVLRPRESEPSFISFFSPLGALAIRAALVHLYGLAPEIKWPNDVLSARKKLAGILVENAWEGPVLKVIVIGIGINITRAALPPPVQLLFPATCVEDEVGRSVSRWELLAEVLAQLIELRDMLGSREFFEEWSSHLAFKGERVCISGSLKPDLVGRLTGIDPDGDLLIETDDAKYKKVKVGDVRLRAV
jgi:BirA family transcriptional regulator, biotin operon repressor / biotin---[acetyl-CoA-carboxylase] ligase